MADFKIEDNIPLPPEPEDPSEELDRLLISADDEDDDEDPEVPGKRGRKPRCRRNDLHRWEDIGNGEEKCELCSEIFPCRNVDKCFHYDCHEARGSVHPWIADGTMVQVGDTMFIDGLELQVEHGE